MRKPCIVKTLTGILISCVLLAVEPLTTVVAQSLSQGLLQNKAIKEGVPIHIVSDRMVADNKNQRIYFIGNVTATRGDLVIHSDRLEVYRNVKTEKIDRIEAIGRVDIRRDGKYATADKAVYDDGEQKIVLVGNPKAWENDNIIVGHKMSFYLKTDQLIVEGGSNRRVDVVLYPTKESARNQGRSSTNDKKSSAQKKSGNEKDSSQAGGTTGDPRTRKVVSEPSSR